MPVVINPPVELSVRDLSANALQMVGILKSHMLAPDMKKKPPVFTQTEILNLGLVNRDRWRAEEKKNPEIFPPGTKTPSGRLSYSLVEARFMVKHFRKILSDRNKSAKVITICNYKGGVGKSTTAAILAQGLSQRGLDVLAIDLDAQGSLTNLFGCLPDFDISDDKTVLPLFLGQKNNLEESVLKTYWDGVDLIGASPLLHSAEFLMPDIILKSNDGKSKWNTLNEGLTSLRDKYDVIIIDTPPSLSFGTLNAIFAANALVMPLPPSPLDFLSSAQFWSSCDEAIDNFKISDGVSKEFDFINILINRADYTSPVSVSVREWIIKTYGSRVLASEIPKTSIADTASSEFGTIFDLDPARSIRKSYKRALLAYDLFVDTVDRQIQASNKSNSENKEKA